MYGPGHHPHSHHHHHHYPNAHHRGGPAPGAPPTSPESAKATDVFEQFIAASTFKSVLHHHRHICELLKLRPTNFRHFYPKLKSKIRSWKAQALWSKYDKRASHKCYNHGKAGENSKVLIIGAGPCGLRSAIEAQLLGAKVVVVEKRDRFSRNNVLHLWPFVIADLRALGAKKFYGKFCAGAIDHISIRQLQCILLKAALLLGVEVIESVTFEELLEPPDDQSQRIGWHARFSPADHPVNQYEFDVLIGADGKRNTLLGFKRKEFRGKLAIAITANFINRHSEHEARVQEISGVAFIFNQKFFKELYAETRIDLENIVYYKDETHYFVMTAKKHSLIDKGVILNDYPDTQQLLHPNNVDREALCSYAREAADFSTNGLLPHNDFAVNHYGKPDIAMFDFTSMFQADNACRVVEKHGHKLLQCLVGDSLLEPFWPTGSGCPRGFLSSFDACWGIRSWASGKMTPLEVIAERESTYRLLAQTTPENLQKDIMSYTLDPVSRYQSVNLRAVLPFQVKSHYITDNPMSLEADSTSLVENQNDDEIPRKRKRRDSTVHPDTLLSWVQKQVEMYPDITVEDMTSSFKDGRILCAIIHRYCPNLIDFDSLQGEDCAENIQLAFDVLERDFAIPPVMTGLELANCDIPDKLTLMSYISQIYDVFRGEIPQFMGYKPSFTKNNLDLGDFPEAADSHSCRESSSLSSMPTKREKSLRCRVMEEAALDSTSKEDLHLTKKRKNELGSLDKLNAAENERPIGKAIKQLDPPEPFSDRVKDLESKFKNGAPQKPKDMVRAIGKIEKTDWNLAAIEKKIEDNVKPLSRVGERERVPKWSKDLYNDKHHNIERRLRENGEDEDRIAKYVEIDDSLKRLEKKLREGSTLETGLRGHNKVSNLANQLSSKWRKKEEEKLVPKQTKPMVLQSSASDLCHFCNTRVYLMERLSAEGKFFHRKCFKCNYCGVFLRPGTYVYDRDGRYGGKFFCIPHLGMTTRNKMERKQDEIDVDKENLDIPPLMAYQDRNASGGRERSRAQGGLKEPNTTTPLRDTRDKANKLLLPSQELSPLGNLLSMSHLTSSLEDRGTTPERAEFENSVLQQSDEDEYLSEDEWTDRNFGASANELDDSDDDSDYSDLGSDEEGEIEGYEGECKLTIDETRRLAESWKRRYSTDALNTDNDEGSDLEVDSDGNLSEGHAADGDESHTATEEGEDGLGAHDDEEDDDAEDVRKARELRRMELNINFNVPERVAETSDSGSETEIASDEESEESDTQIDTDSEFADDIPASIPKEIPTIVINETRDFQPVENEDLTNDTRVQTFSNEPRTDYVQKKIELSGAKEPKEIPPNAAERSASMSNIPKMQEQKVLSKEPLNRALQKTESTEAVTAQKNLQLRRQYLLGGSGMAPKKSVSSADLGNRFKNFMDKISKTQQMLNPAPEPSPAMQAFLNSSKPNLTSSPLTPYQEGETRVSPITSLPPIPQALQIHIPEPKQESSGMKQDSSESSKSDEGKVFVFPTEEIKKDSNVKVLLPTLSNESENLKKEEVLSLHKISDLPKTSTEKLQLDAQLEFNNKQNLNSLEKSHLKNGENCIDAKNKDVICLFEENSKHLFTNGDSTLEELMDRDVIEAVNCEMIPQKDSPEGNIDEHEHSGASEVESDIDRIFDELASDAINEMNLLNKDGIISRDLFLDFSADDDALKTPVEVGLPKSDKVHQLDEEIVPTTKLNDKNLSPISPSQDISVQSVSQSEPDLSEVVKRHFATSDDKIWLDEFEEIPEIKEMDMMPSFDKFQDYHLTASVQSPLARISSLESFEDSYPISIKDPAEDAKPITPVAVSEGNIEFMDTSDSEKRNDSSSPEGTVSPPISYDMLEEETPTAPIIPVQSFKPSSTDYNQAADKNLNPIVPPPVVNSETKSPKWGETKSLSLKDEDKLLPNESTPRSFSEPPSIEEAVQKTDRQVYSPRVAHSENLTPKRYEACIPRFKGRVTPFRSARDSIDVMRNTPLKPLFTPKNNVNAKEKSVKPVPLDCPVAPFIKKECTPRPDLSSSSNSSSFENKDSPVADCKIKSPLSKPKDGDLVRDMVMSRISRKSPDKMTRRNSRPTLFPLSDSSSKSSIFDSKSSLEKSSDGPLFFSPHEADRNENFDSKSASLVEDTNKDVASPPHIVEKPIEPMTERSMSFKSPNDLILEEKVIKKSPLPATPLTHPEIFQSPNRKLDLVQNTSSPPPSTSSFSENAKRKSPRPISVGSFEQVRQASIHLSDAHEQRPKLDKEDRLQELLAEHRRKETENKESKLVERDRDSCVKECLEEYRQKRMSEPIPKVDFKMEKSSVSTPPLLDQRGFNQEPTIVPSPTPLPASNVPQFYRPSRLELESMQVFSTSPKQEMRAHFCSSIAPAASMDFTPLSMTQSDYYPSQNELSKSTSAVNVSENTEKKVKKSKDRERRRSLIQVFAGMFKTDEKKKASSTAESESSFLSDTNVSKSSPNVSSPAPSLSPTGIATPPQDQTPKSPSVRQRLSKLRLTRPKEKTKQKEKKNRSLSAGKEDISEPSTSDNPKAPPSSTSDETTSLPTSPSRTMFSFLSSARINEKPHASTPPPAAALLATGPLPKQPPKQTCRYTSSHLSRTPLPNLSYHHGQQHHYGSPPSIKEENYSDDEIGGTPERELAGSHNQSSSLRRQRAALRAARQAKNKRLRMAQEIQRQLEEWEVQTRELEDRGIWVEKALRGEMDTPKDEADLMRDWFALVHEKNGLARWGRELSVKAQELELEDRHVSLEDELRQRMACLESEKSRDDINREGIILADMLKVLEEKESLSAQFEQDKRRYLEEDRDLDEIMMQKGIARQHLHTSSPHQGH